MSRLHRSCLSHSSAAISETCGRCGAIQNLMTPVGVQATAGGFLTPDYQDFAEMAQYSWQFTFNLDFARPEIGNLLAGHGHRRSHLSGHKFASEMDWIREEGDNVLGG
jgi:hypothetical protein